MVDASEKEPGVAGDLTNAVRARVEQLRGASNEVESRRRELEERERALANERELVETRRKDLEERTRALELREERLRAREEDLDRFVSESLRAQREIDSERERLGALADDLRHRERNVRNQEAEIAEAQARVAERLQEASERVESLVDREELLAQREAALSQSLERLVRLGTALASREKALLQQQDAFARANQERVAAARAREEELAATIESMSERLRAEDATATELAEALAALRNDLGEVAKERDRLVAHERSLLEIERSIASIVDPVPEGAEAPEDPPQAEAEGSDVSEGTPDPEPAPAAEAASPEDGEDTLLEEFVARAELTLAPLLPVDAGEAMQRMSEAFAAARRARDAGMDVGPVYQVMGQVRAALESGDYERAVRLSDEILERVTGLPPAR